MDVTAELRCVQAGGADMTRMDKKGQALACVPVAADFEYFCQEEGARS